MEIKCGKLILWSILHSQVNSMLLETYSSVSVMIPSNADVTTRFSVLSIFIISPYLFSTVITSNTIIDMLTNVIPVSKRITTTQLRLLYSSEYYWLSRPIMKVRTMAKNIIATDISRRIRGWNFHSFLYYILIDFLHFSHEIMSVEWKCWVCR